MANSDLVSGRSSARSPRVWLIHDWLNGMRGGEKVLLRLVRMFPQAKIATLFYAPGTTCPEIESRIERVSFLQRWPGVSDAEGGRYRDLLPLMPKAIREIELPEHDLVISSSHCVAKGIRTTKPHLCYCYTPMRYVWETREHYEKGAGSAGGPGRVGGGMGGAVKMMAARILAGPLRDADLALNESVTRFACTCRNVAERIERCYGRSADVIYPGVENVEEAELSGEDIGRDEERGFYLVVSALVPYKRVDLAVATFSAKRMRGRKLVVIGKGPELERLQALAQQEAAGGGGRGNIEFLGWRSDDEVRAYYRRARALVFPGEEDFGLTPLEAQACGTPVIAYGRGGALETLTAETGVFFAQQTPDALAAAVLELERRTFDPQKLRAWAATFSWDRFDAAILRTIREMMSR